MANREREGEAFSSLTLRFLDPRLLDDFFLLLTIQNQSVPHEQCTSWLSHSLDDIRRQYAKLLGLSEQDRFGSVYSVGDVIRRECCSLAINEPYYCKVLFL